MLHQLYVGPVASQSLTLDLWRVPDPDESDIVATNQIGPKLPQTILLMCGKIHAKSLSKCFPIFDTLLTSCMVELNEKSCQCIKKSF